MPNDSNIPAIRTFQMDASTAGNLRSSVNLFRGDVNYNETLFTMPGKGGNDGLEVKIALQYQSNVNQSVITWNRDNPTGIVGLGWSLGNSVITLDDSDAVATGVRRYTFQANGINSRMVREPQNSMLFEMDDTLASELKDTKPVPNGIRDCFVNNGLALSPDAIVAQTSSGWTINDAALQQQFNLVDKNNYLMAYDGGESYQLVNYNFWKFIYYPRYERWSITTDSGTKLSFGGIDDKPATAGTYKVGIGNSIEWGVLWVNDDGKPVWKGNSAQTSGQQQYARAWNMSRAYNIWGDFISYGYNEWDRDDNSLLPEVEQQVGNGGLPYTKACYLTSITDAFGRKATFEYKDKLWSNTNKTDAREYCDPHKTTPNSDPNGFQDRYETRYLSGISVDDHNSNILFSIRFLYSVSNLAEEDGDFAKRLLTGFHMSNQYGQVQPGFLFDYITSTQPENTHLGALSTITYPMGGSANYQYMPLSLTNSNRSLNIEPPAPMTGGSPRVWFGPDYAVSNWYDEGNEQLSLQIHTWTGQWLTWQADADALISTKGIDLNSLDVITGSDFVALSFKTSSSVDIYIYRKDPARPAQWVAAEISGGGSGGNNAPTLTYPLDDGEAQIQAGQQFVLIAQMDTTQNKGIYDRLTWDWTTRSWGKAHFTTDHYTWLTVASDHYVSVDLEGVLTLSYLDADLVWQNSEPLTLAGFPAASSTSVVLRGSSGMVAVSNLTSHNSQKHTYQVSLIQWDEHYRLTQPSVHDYDDRLDRQFPTTWVPTIISNTLVAVAGHLIRFNGQAWLENNSLMPTTINTAWEQRYAYGLDYATLVYVAPNGGATASLLSYDANSSGDNWVSTPTDITGLTVPADHIDTANWPSAGGGNDYLAVGSQLFFRGTASNWSSQVGNSIADIQTSINTGEGDTRYQLNSKSMINEGSQFLACSVYDTNTVTETQVAVLVLKNGNLYESAQVISGETIWTNDGHSSAAGKYPGGSQMFAAYPDTCSSFDQATRFTLNHYAGDAIKGDITHYAVTGLTIHDGLAETSNTIFEPDSATASCDVTGQVIKYHKNTVYPGSNTTERAYGSVENHYLNGVEIVTGNNYYNMLDGMLYSVITKDKDGNELSVQTSQYTAYVQRAGHPTDNTIPARNLKGAYILPTQKDTREDGLENTSAVNYIPEGLQAPYTGQPVSKSSPSLSGEGIQTFISAEFRYACEVSALANVLNNLTGVVEQSSHSTPKGGTAVKTSASNTALIPWPSNWPGGAMVPAEEADFGWLSTANSFPFVSYQQGDTPSGWQATNRILSRLTDGSVSEREDGGETPQAMLYSNSLALPVAVFSGSRLTECAYYGFEAYENTDNWQQSNLTYNTNDTHTGTRSGCLQQAKGATLSTVIKPQASRKTIVLGFWYKTADGYHAAGSGWSVTGGNVDQTVVFEDTQGKWLYQTVGIELPAESRAITATAFNDGNGDVLLDNIVLFPLGTEVAVSIWHPQRRLLSAAMDQAGRTTLTRYNRFDRIVAAVGADGQLQELSQRFFSRQGSKNDQFEDASPNAELTLHAANAGSLETFLNGEQWRCRWQPTHADSWLTSSGTLSFSGGTADKLKWVGQQGDITSVAYYVEVLLQNDLTTALGINFANGYQIRWTPGDSPGWSWTDSSDNVVQLPLSSPPNFAAQWLLVVSADNVVQFYGDGQLLFCHNPAALSDCGQFAIVTGGNALELHNLSTAQAPRLGVSYTDGGARQRQTHQLHASGSLAIARLYDPLDRQIASTRIAAIEFGHQSGLLPMQYSAAFVDVAAFMASLTTTWKMSGYVADYYADQGQETTVSRSNDQGYPYSGIRYEASSRARQLENGEPGLENAIHDVNTTTPKQRHTIKTNYGLSKSNDPLPAGDYFARTTISGEGYSGRRLINSAGNMVASIQYDTDGNNVSESGALLHNVDEGDAYTQSTLKLPNAYTNSPQSDPNSYIRMQKQDPLAQVDEMQDSDSGVIQYIYDGKGNLRFTQPATDPGEQYYLYSRYDTLGRIIEEGYVNGSWSESSLKAMAHDQSRPNHSIDGAVVCRSYIYDGDGNNANVLGKLIKVITYNQAPQGECDDCTVIEQWHYDASGLVTKASLTTLGLVDYTATACYSYNNINELVSVEFPDGNMPLAKLIYQLDDQGRITAISTSAATLGDVAAYTYNADGSVATETLAQKLPATFNYDSKSQLLNYSVSVNNQAVFSLENCYNYDGILTNRTRTFAFSSYSDQRSIHYQYDGQQRLISADVEDDKPGNETVSLYDANGNIWQGSQNGHHFETRITPGTNQLQSATLASGDNVSFDYRNDGRPNNWRGIAITYDNGSGAMAMASTGSKKVRFCYGINNHRIIRAEGQDTRIRFYGAGNMPLVDIVNGQASLSIWGPTGLVALHDGNIKIPLKDTQDTVWGWADSSGELLAHYDFLPFGTLISRSGDDIGSLPIQFMGKEYDTTLNWYDFGARAYDPALLRFLAPDQARQYASPYVFVGNCPLSFTDPSGNISIWAQVGIAVAMVAVTAVGLALTPVTGGASDAAAAGVDASLAGAAATDAAVVAAEAGAEVAADAGAGIAAEAAGAEASAEVATGVSVSAESGEATASAAASSSVGSNISYVAQSAGLSAMSGSGMSGLTYDLQHGRDFTASGFLTAIGIGAAGGAVSGGLGGLITMPASAASLASMSLTRQILTQMVAKGATSMVASDLKTILTDVASGQKITVSQMLKSSAIAFATGAASGTFSAVKGIKPDATAVNSAEKVAVKASTLINKISDGAKAAAKTETAYAVYITGGFFSVGAYATWGAYEAGKR